MVEGGSGGGVSPPKPGEESSPTGNTSGFAEEDSWDKRGGGGWRLPGFGDITADAAWRGGSGVLERGALRHRR
jgi:hypothetical protein